MAMAKESFSIREYAARMRSKDLVKCWPFKEAEKETIETMLPPITIKKFRWWFDELELVHSNCAGYGESSRKKLEDEGKISDLESETIESMRMKRVEKMKPVKGKLKLKNKPPKERSIVELFAVSPQVERVNSDVEENADNSNAEEDCDNDSVQEGGLPNSELVLVQTLHTTTRKVFFYNFLPSKAIEEAYKANGTSHQVTRELIEVQEKYPPMLINFGI